MHHHSFTTAQDSRLNLSDIVGAYLFSLRSRGGESPIRFLDKALQKSAV